MTLLLFALCSVAGMIGLIAASWYITNVAVPALEASVRGNRFTKAARARARALFLSKLDRVQRRDWFLRKKFIVIAPSGRRYTIGTYSAFNIAAAWDAAFCLAVEGESPDYDKLLAQKLLIECDESRFLATANVRTFSRKWIRLIATAREECRLRGIAA
jgi:hypothetical protein